jgi:GDP-L-fucose synthase
VAAYVPVDHIVIQRTATIYLAGHQGMVGSAIERRLRGAGYENILTRSKPKLDLIRQQDVESWFAHNSIDIVILAAAKVGGIYANNTYRAEFIYQNLMIQANVIHNAYRHGVKHLVFLGSSCIYPRDCPQPMREEYLLTGALEKTNEPYAVAKIAGLKMCEAYNDQYGTRYISLMPTNLYGANDNFDPHTSHVLPAVIRKIHEAKIGGQKIVSLWGTGRPLREFLHVDDLADACLFVMEHEPAQTVLNVGSGEEISIRELGNLVADTLNYQGSIVFDPSMPDGTPRKLLDSGQIFEMGWRPKISLREGVERTYNWYLNHSNEAA